MKFVVNITVLSIKFSLKNVTQCNVGYVSMQSLLAMQTRNHLKMITNLKSSRYYELGAKVAAKLHWKKHILNV